MRGTVLPSILSGLLLAGGSALLLMTGANAQEETGPAPRLVTFGTDAQQYEGDHDFRQLIRLFVPDTAGPLYLRVFDPDVAGAFDEPQRGFNTRTQFSLYGAGGVPRLYRDADGIIQETVEGEALASVTFGADPDTDGRWLTLFPIDVQAGRANEGMREFVLAVEGLSGDDGNVFDVAVSRSETANEPLAGVRLLSYAPTFQITEEGEYAELRFAVPQDADMLIVENFDSAGAGIGYAGRFHSAPLTPSEKSKWRRETITLRPGEAGRAGSIVLTGGAESPNDATVVVSVPDGQGGKTPVAIDLPIRVVQTNTRPFPYYGVEQTACGEMVFDASIAFDGDGDDLSFRWLFDDTGTVFEGSRVVRQFAQAGDHDGRLEIFDSSGTVANGRAVDFTFHVKLPPVAVFEAPELVAQGATLRLDGTASTTNPRPPNNRIERYTWDFGDGGQIVQQRGDDDFGQPSYRYVAAGDFVIQLTVSDGDGQSCNTATTTRTISVNAPPVADGGGDRELLTGEIALFDGSASRDPDGSIASYWWDFEDGRRVYGPTARHSFHAPGVYEVRLNVLDDTIFESATDTDVVTVTVRDPVNQRPSANGGESRFVSMGEVVTFDASASTDEDGRLLHYDWDFGDGSGDDKPVTQHTYWEPGTYTVNLTVKDERADENGQSVATLTITVIPADNRAPVIDFPSELETTLYTPLRFDASSAFDRDGSIVSYRWDFGDGATGSGPVVEHRYDQPGTFRGSLLLTDDGLPEPRQTRVGFTVEVGIKANVAPVAKAGTDVTAIAGEEVLFDASASADADGAVRSFEWDFGDGHRATGIHTRHIYQFPGRYEVTLRITDNQDDVLRLEARDTLTVTVVPPDNAAPRAAAGSDRTVSRGEIVRFDGTGSSDPDGNILTYAWDFGDGGRSPDARPVHAFHDTGTYTVRLTVSDDGAPVRTDEAEVVVTVVEASDRRASQ